VTTILLNAVFNPPLEIVHRSGLLARAMDNFKRRIENCIQEDGRHLNDIIFHT